MVLDTLYHPPIIEINHEKSGNGALYLNHVFEGKPLYRDFIPNTLMGIEYLWGKPVKLETVEVTEKASPAKPAGTVAGSRDDEKKEYQYQRVLYTMENRKVSKKNI